MVVPENAPPILHDGPALSGRLSATGDGPLRGTAMTPGDKSISHRAILFGALADGESIVHGLLEGEDVLRTAAAMRQFGARVDRMTENDAVVWRVVGAPWRSPDRPVYFGNSGTGVRLVMGAAAAQGVRVTFDGDGSLRKRPMGRIVDPLAQMGALFATNDGALPVVLDTAPAASALRAIDYRLPVASAQVKSAVLLAALGAQGRTIVREPIPSRDHTERMLTAFGATLDISDDGGVRTIALVGGQRLTGQSVTVPGDPSSAAFPIAAAVITPGSDVVLRNILLNPLRIGFVQTLQEMGADVTIENQHTSSGEQIGDIRARYSAELKGLSTPVARAPAMIDEYPILAVVAAFATGTTRLNGVGELRVKESDRIAATEAMLNVNGVKTASGPDWLQVEGLAARPKGGAQVTTHADHRIAMSALVLGLGAENPVEIDDASMIATSFPTFASLMVGLGAGLTNHG